MFLVFIYLNDDAQFLVEEPAQSALEFIDAIYCRRVWLSLF